MNPSLLLIPDRYKKDKLYSQIPDSGAGDLTFARNSSATRVNSAGLIEKVRTNLVLQSEALNEAAWTKNRSTITANALINPVNGATTADYIVEDTSNGTHEAIQILNVTSGLGYTFSVYAKADTRTKIALILAGSAFSSPSNGQAIFDLSGGTIISTAGGATSSITSIGAGWYRCSITKTAGDTSGILVLSLVDASNNVSYTGDGASRAAFFGSQFEVSDFGATPYIPTTTAAVSVGITADIPRLDYTGGGCPSLLLEPQRTNLITFSEQLDNAYWTTGGTVSANSTASPDGSINADKLVEGTGSVLPIVELVTTLTASTTFTQSVFAKAEGRRYLLIGNNANTGFAIRYCCFDLQTGVVVANNISEGTPKIEAYANGFYRCSISFSNSLNIPRAFQYIYQNAASATPTAYTGDGVSGVSFYGFQLELGSYVSSYIPTLGSSVTRLADVASKGSISSLVNNTEGTLYFEVLFDKLYDAGGAGPSGLEIGDGGNFANIISIGVVRSAQNVIRAINRSSSSNVFVNVFNVNTVGKYKCAFSYGATGNSFYVNGALVSNYTTGSSSTAAIVNSFSRLTLGGAFVGGTAASQNNDGILAAAIYPVRLSNAELAQLTSL